MRIKFFGAFLLAVISIGAAAELPPQAPAKAPAKKKQATGKKSTQAPKQQAAVEQKPQMTIPKDAQQIEPYAYRWVDAKGKAWIFRETPFGIVKIDEAATAPVPQAPAAGIVAVEEGDSVRFEKPTPFGSAVKWTRKKSELTAEEREALERAQARKN